MPKNIKILLVSHKPFKIPESEYFLPVHAGRKIALQTSKDGKIDPNDFKWMLDNTIGDDSGENISEKNRYYSECSALYWAWKNYDRIGNPDYIGLMHYRRHFIFNDEYYENNIQDNWHKALAYKNEDFIDEKYLENIGLNDENINEAINNFEIIVSKQSHLKLIHGHNLRQNYEATISGAKVKDFDLMIEIIKEKFPQYYPLINEKINGDEKYLYQMFIMKKDYFFEYCDFLFNVLFEVENRINFDSYTVNGKRTLGYLAELLLTFYIWKKEQENISILKLGVTEVEFPYTKDQIHKFISKQSPSHFEYLRIKVKSFFAKGEEKRQLKEKYQSIRRQIKFNKKLKNYIKENT